VAGLIVLSNTLAGPASLREDVESKSALCKATGGKPLPFRTDEEVKEFLRTAAIVEMEDIPIGVNHARKATLEKYGVRLHVVFRGSEIYKQKWDDHKHGPWHFLIN
jgi:hypothetical protein